MGQVTLVVEKCGCYVQQDTYGEEKVEVVYCPKHKAAPEMYEALKELCANLSMSCSTDYLYKHNLSLPLSKAQKALAKAEGKK